MADPTIWPKEPHTDAKHRILEAYLKAWFPILAKYNRRIIYIDGFAGPGTYEKGEMGSPLIALHCLLSHSLELCQKNTEFAFLFIEKDAERAKKLEQKITENYPNCPKNVIIKVYNGEFESTMTELLNGIEEKNTNLAPTFAFIDPFGYSGLPLHLIKRILAFSHCEVFINFAYESINRFSETQDSRERIFDKLFDTEEWQKVRNFDNVEERNRELTALYTKQLKTGARYVRSFEMINNSGKVTYYLYFATNHIKGFEQMKTAMWRVDPRGSFRFADTTDVNQSFLLSFEENTKFKEQAEIIFDLFKGKSIIQKKLKDYCIEYTAFPTLWSNSLKSLRQTSKYLWIIGKEKDHIPQNV